MVRLRDPGFRLPFPFLEADSGNGPLQDLRAFDFSAGGGAAGDQASPPDFPGRISRRIILGANLPPGVRREIEAGFQAPVFETYACRETALIAWECPATGELHVCDDHIILEVLDQGLPVAPGEAGEVIVTVLHSFAQPFLRYRIHDVVVRGTDPCSCGAPYSTLHRVEGRTNDRILFPGARSRPPGPIFDFMEEQTDWIRQFQLVQERLDLVILKLVVSRRPEPQKLRSLEMVCRNFLGPEFEFKVEFVDELMSEPGTKFRPSLCRIQPPDEDLPAW